MAVPFGFSAGDFMAAIHTVHKIATALREIDGASSEFNQTICELNSIEGLLRSVQNAYSADVDPLQLDRLQILVHECYIPLDRFLSKMKDLEPSLGSRVPRSKHIIDKAKRAARKVQWGLQVKKEVSGLTIAMGPRISAINMQLHLINIECQQKAGLSQNVILKSINDLPSHLEIFQRSLDIRINSLATMTSMENVSQTLQDMRLEAKEYHNQQIGAISKRLDVQAGSLDLNTSQQVLDAIRSLTFKIADQQSWPRTSTIQIAAHLDPETRSCSIDHSGTSCGDQGRIKRIEDELSDQKQQLQLLTGKFGELQLSGSQPQENGNIIEQDVQETIQHSIQALFGFFRTRTDALFLKLWIILPVVQHVFRNLQAPRLFVSLTIGESIVFEDVLGRVVHLPYKDFRHYTVFIERLRCEFEGKPGKNEVLMNQFHIFRHGQCDQFLTQENWNVGIRPGSRIAMSIVLDIHYGGEDKCPRCKATETNLGTNGILQCTACGLNWALQKLDPPYTSSRRLYSEEATSDLPLPQNIRNMEENEQYSSSAPLPDSSGGSSHSVDNKDIEKFRMVHVEKRDPSAYMDATSSIASYLETIGFTLKGSFPWKPSYKGITVKSALMEAMQNVPSYMLEHDGLMYIFWCKSSSKILKIGTTRNVTRLFAECTRCCGPAYRYDRKLYSGEEMRLPFAHIVETLVHIELSDYHLHVECWKHRIKHFGHFYVSKSHAMRVIQKWKRWILQDPYMRNADGQWVLKPPFKAQVAEMCRPLAMEN